MLRFEVAANAFRDCFRAGRLWLLQCFANPVLLAFLAAWLLIPVASDLHLIANFVFAFVLIIAMLWLHGGTLNYFVDRQRDEITSLWPAFRRALRHLIPFAMCVGIFCLFWLLVGKMDAYQSTFTASLRSALPVSIRRRITLPTIDALFSALLFAVRWILVPGLLLPFFAQAADRGFRGFGPQGLSAWRKTVFNIAYWVVLLVAALLGVFATQNLMAWTPDFKTSTLHSETISFAARLFFAYVFGLFSWMLACSVVGRRNASAGSCENVTGNPPA